MAIDEEEGFLPMRGEGWLPRRERNAYRGGDEERDDCPGGEREIAAQREATCVFLASRLQSSFSFLDPIL